MWKMQLKYDITLKLLLRKKHMKYVSILTVLPRIHITEAHYILKVQSYHHFFLKHSLTTLFSLSKNLLRHDAYANVITFLKFLRSPSQLSGLCSIHVDIKPIS